MRKILVLLFIINCGICSYSQTNYLKEKLYKIEDRIISGDINALKEIAVYIDDTTFVQEFLGYHNYPNKARGIAIRIIEENCLFADEEFKLDSTISTSKFLTIVNSGKIKFDDLTGMFLFTNLTERKTNYELKKITDNDLKRVDTIVGKTAYPSWYYENQIDGFLVTKNPEALKWIASAWFQKRTRFNRYYFNDEEFLDLIKKLTRVDLGVSDEKGKITFLYKDDYSAKARLNYLIYWVNHCKDYKWSDEKQYFENINEKAVSKSKEEYLFEMLNSEIDSVAIDAYKQLTELDTTIVKRLATEYDANDIDNNYSLPTFLYRFIKQAVQLTQYCRDNQVKYKTTGWLIDSLDRLKQEISYSSRYRLENYIIQTMNLSEVTIAEYYGLIYEQEWDVTYSIGRILDKFYSCKWKELISDRKYLTLYLKKAKLFDDLGIIGICNKYRRKFENCSDGAINNLKIILTETNDKDVKEQINKVLVNYRVITQANSKEKKIWDGNSEQYGVDKLKANYQSIKLSKKDDDDKKYDIQKLFGKINYQQIGEAIRILEKDTSLEAYDKFHFIESDFGFYINIYDSLQRVEFLALHSKKTEKELCEYYLKKMGIECFDKSGNLYFPGIYEVLKYDVVDAFAGGGGGRREDGVYMVIKLLESEFKTTLGFPQKLCSRQGMYACHSDERAKAWMKLLEEKKLVTPDKTEPPSISYNN